MRLNALPNDVLNLEVAESDPLPPEDRVPAVRPAFSEDLYRTHRDELLRVIRRRVRDERALDVVQQVFCRLARLNDAEQQKIVAPGPYLRRAAGNLLRDDARQADGRLTFT